MLLEVLLLRSGGYITRPKASELGMVTHHEGSVPQSVNHGWQGGGWEQGRRRQHAHEGPGFGPPAQSNRMKSSTPMSVCRNLIGRVVSLCSRTGLDSLPGSRRLRVAFLVDGLQPTPFHLLLELLTPRCGVLPNAVLGPAKSPRA